MSRIVFLILTLATLYRLAIVIGVQHKPVVFDALKYSAAAINLINEKKYSVDGKEPFVLYVPGYSLFLAGIYKLAGLANYQAVRVIQAILSGLNLWLLYKFIKKWRNKKTAIAGLIVAAVYFPFAYANSFILTEVLYTIVLLIWMNHLVRTRENWFGNGMLLGLVFLVRPALGLFWPTMGWFWLKKKQLAALLLGAVVTLSPWIARNYFNFKQLIIFPKESGHVFLMGTYRNYEWGPDMVNWPQGRTLAETDDLMMKMGFDKLKKSLREDWTGTLGWYLKKIELLWWFPYTDNIKWMPSYWWQAKLHRAIILLAICGVVILLRNKDRVGKLLVMILVYSTGLHVVFMGLDRLAFPMMYLVIGMAAVPLAKLNWKPDSLFSKLEGMYQKLLSQVREMWRDNYVKALILVAAAVTTWAMVVVPHGRQCYGGPPFYENCDSPSWFAITKSFSAYRESILKHRPLFGITAWMIYQPLKIVGLAGYFFPFITETLLLNWVWRFQNIIFYLAMIGAAYFGIKKWTGSASKAFFFAVLAATSSHAYAWLLQPLNNIQGFFILYVSIWMVVDYLKSPAVKKLILYSLIYGVLMLGKGQFNIWASLGVATLLLAPKRIKEMIFFTLIQLVPLLVWLGVLRWANIPYENYEMKQGAFTWVAGQIFPLTIGSVLSFSHNILGSINGMLFVGLGPVAAVVAWITLGKYWPTKAGKLMLIYFLTTGVFLYLVRFSIPRHAPDFAPVVYLGMAGWLDGLKKKYEETWWFWKVMALILVVSLAYNFWGQVIISRVIY